MSIPLCHHNNICLKKPTALYVLNPCAKWKESAQYFKLSLKSFLYSGQFCEHSDPCVIAIMNTILTVHLLWLKCFCRSVCKVFGENITLPPANCSFKQKLLCRTFYRHRWNSFCHLNTVYIQESSQLSLWHTEKGSFVL